MELMIEGRHVVPARYRLLEHAAGGAEPAPGSAIPLAEWLRLRESGAALRGVGVVVDGPEDLAPLQPHLAELPLIALRMRTAGDSAIYAQAYRVRRVWGYGGVMLACGAVTRDHLVYLGLLGFDAFYLHPDEDAREALAALSPQAARPCF